MISRASEIAKVRPYMANFRKDAALPAVGALPAVAAKEDKIKSGWKSEFRHFETEFANAKAAKFKRKQCPPKCSEFDQCTKQCKKDTETKKQELIEVLTEHNYAHPLEPVVRRIERGEDLDTIVLVEDRKFACTGIVLGTYSEYFREYQGFTEVDLRKGPLTVKTFDTIYKWMVTPDEYFHSEDVVDLIRAALYLRMPTLVEQCYEILDSPTFTEFGALEIMHKARSYDELMHINVAMASRICTCTLIVLCTREFLELSETQVCALLKSSALCVNSETEILYGVLHWLKENWPKRCPKMYNVVKHIRYSYLSPKMLSDLNGPTIPRIGPFHRVLKEFKQSPEIMALVEDGIFLNTLVITMGGDVRLMEDVPSPKKELLIPRQWIQDTRCKYHRPVTKLCPNMRTVTYKEFAEYSEILLDSDLDYERFIVFPNEEKNKSKESSESSEPSESSRPTKSGHLIYLSGGSNTSVLTVDSSPTEESDICGSNVGPPQSISCMFMQLDKLSLESSDAEKSLEPLEMNLDLPPIWHEWQKTMFEDSSDTDESD